MKYIVYKTTNTVNNKIYIGVHITKNPDIFDGYIGCGITSQSDAERINKKGFPLAVRKYGYVNFKRETLFIYDGDENGCVLAYQKEKELVTAEFIKRKDTYNIVLGGRFTAYESLKRPINQYTIDGKYLKTWDSITDARLTTGISCITNNLVGKYKHCGGYQWRYYENNIDNIDPVNIDKKKVYQFDLSGNLLKVWRTATDAASFYKIAHQAICNCCNKKSHQCIGFYWSYKCKFEPMKFNHLAAVAKYNDNGEFLDSYTSIKEACDKNKIKSPGNLIAAIKGSQKRCRGFRWRYFYGNTNNIKPI